MSDYGTLNAMGAALDEWEALRIASENRLRDLESRGDAADQTYMLVLRTAVENARSSEHSLTLAIQRAMRDHPLGPFVQRTKGLGLKQTARLLAAIGDPYWNALDDRPRRGPAELWAYCGYSPSQKRRKGERANWSADAKMRAYLIAEACMKCRESPYRAVYDEAREYYTDAVHTEPCARCGPKGKPAVAGSPLSAGHQHARAMRRVAKAVLRDLWREAKETSGGAISVTEPICPSPRSKVLQAA